MICHQICPSVNILSNGVSKFEQKTDNRQTIENNGNNRKNKKLEIFMTSVKISYQIMYSDQILR